MTKMERPPYFISYIGVFVILFIVLLAVTTHQGSMSAVSYMEEPVSFDGKERTSFKIYELLPHGSLAREISEEEQGLFFGRVVMLQINRPRKEQIVEVEHPQQIGVYIYCDREGWTLTVPVIRIEGKR